MEKNERMQTVDMSKEFDRLNASDQHFVRKLEQMNLTRAKDMKVMRSRNKLTGLLIGTGVLGVYLYTILSVKQEKFLDDFDKVPEKKS